MDPTDAANPFRLFGPSGARRRRFFPLLVAISFLGPIPLGAEDVPASAPSPGVGMSPGPRELVFRNGRSVRGEVLSVDDARFRFAPYDGPAFEMALDAVAESRPLETVATVRARAAAMIDAGDKSGAFRLLRDAAKSEPELIGDVSRLAETIEVERKAERDARYPEFRREFDELLRQGRLLDAKDLVTRELLRFPDDPDLLAQALLADFSLHRSRNGTTAGFRSPYVEVVRETTPDSAILAGIEAEIGTGRALQEMFEAERESFLATALDRATEAYEAFRLDRAKEILERALALKPPAESEGELRRLLGKVSAERATELADIRARETERRQAILDSLPSPSSLSSGGRSLSDKEFERLKEDMGDRTKVRDIHRHVRRRR